MATPQRRRKLSPQAFRLLMLSASFLGVHARLHAQVIGPSSTPPAPVQSQISAPPAASSERVISMRERTLLFDKLDANHDDKLSPAEAASLPGVGKKFAEFDRNHDGLLSRQEFRAVRDPHSPG